ncbi:MAG: AMP-binding protein, partial [Desulfatiglandales bacterium]
MMTIETRLTKEMIDQYTSEGAWGTLTVGDYLDLAVEKYPNKVATTDSQGGRLTYHALAKVVNRLAKGFLSLGLKKGQIVSVQLPNSIEFSCIYFALAKIGVVINPVLPTFRHSEVEYVLGFSGSAMMIIPREFRKFNYADMIKELWPNLPSLDNVMVLGDSIPDGMISYKQFKGEPWETKYGEDIQQHRPDSNDILVLMYTSGTEAEPKGVLHTHNTIIFTERSFAKALRIGSNDTIMMPSPVTHATGFMHGITLPLITEGRSVLLEIFEAEEALKLIEKERCTYSMGATPFIRRILDCPNFSKYDIRYLRFFLCGGTPIPRELVSETSSAGIKLLSVYGLTESAPHTVTSFDDPVEKISETDGKACPGIEVKIVDENKKEVPRGTVGEEVSRGPNVFVGYFKKPDLTAKCFDDEGWFYSGDNCKMDSDGYIRVVGRKKDIIIRGG